MTNPSAPNLCFAILDDRGLIKIAGEGTKAFLQNLLTNDVLTLAPGRAVYAALLTPQGKIIADFLVTEAAPEKGGGLYLDCPRPLVLELLKLLARYKLRAKITIDDVSETFGVGVAWGANAQSWPPDECVATFEDPRAPALGWRFLAPPAALPAAAPDAAARYNAHRIALGIPMGGIDFAYGETFPHDANFDLIHGIDFKKGCFIGQEVVSRIEHRGTARKRIVRVHFAGPAPRPGSGIFAGPLAIGTFGSAAAETGLALIRTDRAEEAISAGVPLTAGAIELRLAPAG